MNRWRLPFIQRHVSGKGQMISERKWSLFMTMFYQILQRKFTNIWLKRIFKSSLFVCRYVDPSEVKGFTLANGNIKHNLAWLAPSGLSIFKWTQWNQKVYLLNDGSVYLQLWWNMVCFIYFPRQLKIKFVVLFAVKFS